MKDKQQFLKSISTSAGKVGVYHLPSLKSLGTGSLDRPLWDSVVDGFISAVHSFDFLGRHLDIRENVNFRGRYLAQFVHEHFPKSGCVLAIEVRKFFMDEWTGLVDSRQVAALREAFRLGAAAIIMELH